MLKSVVEADAYGKTVLVRVDYNVPLSKGIIQDDTRIRGSLPTIEYLLDNNATIILCSHLGRPGGEQDTDLSLAPIGAHLQNLIGRKVVFISDLNFDVIRDKIAEQSTSIYLLENTRFHPGEKSNDPDFAQNLASLADIFVSDAFGAVHREHASTCGVTRYIPGYAGKLVMKEYERITAATENPDRPALAIFGGAKISTKIDVLNNFIGKADIVVLGGGMANTFLRAKGVQVGKSLVEEDMLDTASSIIEAMEKSNIELILPSDVRLAKEFDEPLLENNVAKVVKVDNIPENAMILDIGPKTEIAIIESLLKSRTITWNGPLGVFEKDLYSNGTLNVAREVVKCGVDTVVGGGETAYAFNKIEMEIPDNIHISTGGGASLELMGGNDLPGLTCLKGKIIE